MARYFARWQHYAYGCLDIFKWMTHTNFIWLLSLRVLDARALMCRIDASVRKVTAISFGFWHNRSSVHRKSFDKWKLSWKILSVWSTPALYLCDLIEFLLFSHSDSLCAFFCIHFIRRAHLLWLGIRTNACVLNVRLQLKRHIHSIAVIKHIDNVCGLFFFVCLFCSVLKLTTSLVKYAMCWNELSIRFVSFNSKLRVKKFVEKSVIVKYPK